MKRITYLIFLLSLAIVLATSCATDTVMTQKQAAEQRQKEVEAAKKQKEELQKKLDNALEQLEEQAEDLENSGDQ